MNFNRKKRFTPEISMTSMVDVVLLLLFFFMVSTTFTRQTEVKINLPEATGPAAEDFPDNVILHIDASGVYYLQGGDGLPHELTSQSMETLMLAIQKIAVQPDKTPFIINADRNTPHEAVIKALDAAARIGYSHISFGALKAETTQ